MIDYSNIIGSQINYKLVEKADFIFRLFRRTNNRKNKIKSIFK